MVSLTNGAKRANGKPLPKTNPARYERGGKTLNPVVVLLKKLGTVWKTFLKRSPANSSGRVILEVLKILATLLSVFWN